MHKVFLTFDVEDFINSRSISSLFETLNLLKKYDLKALFFITGHMSEKLRNFPYILDLLKSHEIGYHSSSHTVRPTIIEYTDVSNYEDAFVTSLQRENSHINPLTGKVEGEGGIELLKKLFPRKKIVSFRAPGLCWSPPHLEALVKLGIQFDFSTTISWTPFHFKGISFSPRPVYLEPFEISTFPFRKFFIQLLRDCRVIGFHYDLFVNREPWDSIYFEGNPQKLFKVESKTPEQKRRAFLRFELFLRYIKSLEKLNLIEVTSKLIHSKKNLTKISVQKTYASSLYWPKKFLSYKPKFVFSHFLHYFGKKHQNCALMKRGSHRKGQPALI